MRSFSIISPSSLHLRSPFSPNLQVGDFAWSRDLCTVVGQIQLHVGETKQESTSLQARDGPFTPLSISRYPGRSRAAVQSPPTHQQQLIRAAVLFQSRPPTGDPELLANGPPRSRLVPVTKRNRIPGIPSGV